MKPPPPLPARIACIAVALISASALTGCQKIRQSVQDAVAKAKASADEDAAKEQSPPGGGVFQGLEQLKDAREDRAKMLESGTGEVRQLAGAGFDDFVGQGGRVVLVDFYADWCGPCRMMAPVLEQVVRTSGARVALGKVNIDRERELAAKWRVSAIPDVRVFRDGRQVEAFVGVRGEAELRALVQRELAQLPPPAGAAGAASGTNPEAPAAPPIQRMEKDWLPKGIERR